MGARRWLYHTSLPHKEAKDRSYVLGRAVDRYFNMSEGIRPHFMISEQAPIHPDYVGPVIIINGTGGSGKDTFIECAQKNRDGRCGYVEVISSVDPVRDGVAAILNAAESSIAPCQSAGYEKMYSLPSMDILAKTDQYRSFMAGTKVLWDKYFPKYGSNAYLLTRIFHILETDKNGRCVAIFVHVRESYKIMDLQKRLFSSGILCLTMLVHQPDAKVWTNSSDANVDDFDYDIHYDNDGTVEDIAKRAETFMYILESLSPLYCDKELCKDAY